jgi:hypothetical protein
LGVVLCRDVPTGQWCLQKLVLNVEAPIGEGVVEEACSVVRCLSYVARWKTGIGGEDELL